jgi:regulator of nucleoside diphosphate kinase
MATRDRNDRAPHSISESIPIWMMRLAGLVKLTKEGVLITNAGREVHRRIITPPPSLDEQKPRRDSGYDSLFIPVPIDNSGSGHLQRVREALRRSERNFIKASSATVLSGIGELRATKSPTKPTNLETMQTRPMNKRNITMTAADHEELTYAIAATGKLSERGRGEMSALEAELSRAAIVDAKDLPTDVITMNSRAELLDLDTGERMEFTLVFPRDAHIEDGKISVLAPLGTAMLGYRVGDEFAWTVPYGMRRLKVTAVQFQPEAALAVAA